MAAFVKMLNWRVSCFSLNSGHFKRIAVIENNFVRSTLAWTSHVQQRQPTRGMAHRSNRRNKLTPTWWMKRRANFVNQYLTDENRNFVKQIVEDKYSASESPLKEPPWPRGEWTPRSRRTGVIARKIGIYPLWMKDGTRLLTTVLQVLDNHVIRYVPPDVFSDNPRGLLFGGKYGCLVVGVDSADPQLFTPEFCGLFEQAGVMPKKKLTRFLVTADAAIQPGTPLNAMHYRVGDYVDCRGVTVEHGFQGGMKRWGMSGGLATHGNTKAHRRIGSIGSGRKMGRIWPGKKMPGHMGSEWRTCKGLKIWRIDTKHNVLWVQGPAVPGGVNSYVYIMDTCIPQKKSTVPLPFPTFYPEDASEAVPEEFYDSSLHSFSEPTITFDSEPEIVVPIASKKKLAKTASKTKR